MFNLITEKENCWDFLANSDKPVFIYGMGDGALKIQTVMEQYHIPIAGFFASDEFVRGHYFLQHKVHSLSEIEKALGNYFIIVLAFSANSPSLIAKINSIAKKHTLLAPDVPVSGEELFTYEYFCENIEKIESVYNILADEHSRRTFIDIINYKISGKIDYLSSVTASKSDVYSRIIRLSSDEIYLDLGAYNGDTIAEFAELTHGSYSRIIALEPDPKNYKKLVKAVADMPKITTINSAAWSCDTTLQFENKAGKQSHISSKPNDSNLLGTTEISAKSVDNILNGNPCSYIKVDVEGAEKDVIIGAYKTIKAFSPKLSISIYHRSEDLFEIPLQINAINSNYKLFIRHHLCIPAWDTNLYTTSGGGGEPPRA